MRARGSGDTECLTKNLQSLRGVRGLAEAMGQQLGPVPEDALRVFSRGAFLLGTGLGQLDQGASLTPMRDEDRLVHGYLPYWE
jgi:hypothetical protein